MSNQYQHMIRKRIKTKYFLHNKKGNLHPQRLIIGHVGTRPEEINKIHDTFSLADFYIKPVILEKITIERIAVQKNGNKKYYAKIDHQ
jgi:hypothetical protein